VNITSYNLIKSKYWPENNILDRNKDGGVHAGQLLDVVEESDVFIDR
jgi:hypothetical protein